MTLVNDERAAAETVAAPVTDRAPKHRIAGAGRDDAKRVAASLALAFYEDPVFRWLSPDDGRRGEMLPHFFGVFVAAYLSHGETYTAAAAAGGALWATRPEQQGAGLGAALMAPVLERCDRYGVPAYLEATSDRNRALYERHGFQARGDIPLPGGPALVRMWRDPRVETTRRTGAGRCAASARRG